MQWQKVSIPFLGGIDTKSDPRALQPQRLRRAENVTFTKRGSLRTRPGSVRLPALEADGTTSIDAAQGLITRGDELCLLDGERLLSYAESRSRWYDRGPVAPLDVTAQTVAAMPSNQLAPDYDEAGGVGVLAWEDSRGGVRYSITDTATGELLYSDQSIASDGYSPRVVAINGFVHILYVDNSSTDLRTKVIKPQDLAASVAAASLQLTTDIRSASNICYDVAVYGSYAVLAWVDLAGTGAVIGKLTKGGSLLSTSTASSPTGSPALTGIAIAAPQGTNENGIGMLVACSASSAHAHRYSASIIDIMASTSWDDFGPAAVSRVAVGSYSWDGGGGVAESGGFVNFALYVEEDAATDDINIVRIYTMSTHPDDEPSATCTIRHACLASGGFRAGDYGAVVLSYVNTIQPTYFVYRHDGVMVGRFGYSEAGGYPRGTRAATQLPNPKGSGQSWQWAGAFRKRLETTPTTNSSGAVTGLNIVREAYEVRLVDLDFSATPAYVEVGNSAIMTGGMLLQYDGQSVTESGFMLAPEGTTASATASSGSLTNAATYAYRVYYEWTNAQGERERSGALPLVADTTGAGVDTVTLTIPTLSHTLKASGASVARGDVSITVYRTEANPTFDAPFYRVSGTDPATASGANRFVANDATADTVSFQDDLADTAIVSRELDYQNSGEFENLAPPTANIIAQGHDRVFLAGLDDPNKVVYSKLHFAGEGLAFSDGLEIVVDRDGGPITALGMLNEQLVIFKRSRIYAVQGTGPSNTGLGEYGPAQLITTDAGCNAPRSIVPTPAGLMFKSAKGIYLLDMGFRVSYVGAEVEAYNDQDVTAAVLVADSNQVRFLTSDGATLLYDYQFGQWATWTNYEGVAAVLWKGETLCRVLSNGRVYQEDASIFTDGGAEIRMLLETGPIRLEGIQGYQRVRRLAIIGEWRSTHTLRVSVGYDGEAAFDYRVSYDPAASINTSTYGEDDYGDGAYGGSGSTVYQFRHRLRRQKCQSVRLLIEAVPSGTPGESVLLTEAAFEVGYRTGLNRVASTKEVA